MFEFTFHVDRLQASIYKSNPSKADKLLANMILEDFDFAFELRQYDMSVDIGLRSLCVEDKMVEDDARFSKLVTSHDGPDGVESPKELVRIKYARCQPESPEFLDVFEGINQVNVPGSPEAKINSSLLVYSLSTSRSLR
jgi:vacuolar protein sorting-associated protein 13A/C